MSSDDLRATRTRPFATTIAAGSTEDSEPRRLSFAPMPSLGSVVGGHYRLVRELGEGNFGKVWVAERLDVPEHRVAMKILPRSHYAGRNVERELVMLATVGHPNVVQLKDHGVTDDFVWLTMPVYEGETLDERLSRGTLGLAEAYDIFLPIARALEALHHTGLRHQDIKPDNIFLARFGGRLHPVLLDLGVAAERDATFVAGTALFAAPEQLAAILDTEREHPLSEKMDTYCLGATILLCLVGDRFFPGAKALTRRQVVESHTVRATTPIVDDALLDLSPTVREALIKNLARWMAVDPTERPSMRQLAEDLEVLLLPQREAEEEAERAKERQRRSLSIARGVALLVLALVAGLGGLALWKRQTLRLASELEAARAAGEENFDKLDTCIASHAIAKREARICGEDLEKERADHERTLSAMAKDDGSGCAEVVNQLKDLRASSQADRKKHEDELALSQRTCNTDKEKLETERTTEREKLTAERETCEKSLTERTTESDQLRGERDACIASQSSPYDPPANPPPIAHPPTTGTPHAPPSSTGSADPSPYDPPSTATPPTSEPPPPPPPPPEEPPLYESSPAGTPSAVPAVL
ncbi:MAG: protein kinase [Polyangiaceae bacterium]